MKLKIYDPQTSINEPKEQLFLKLKFHDKTNCILMCVVDNRNNEIEDGCILQFDLDNRIIMYSSDMNKSIDIKTNCFGEPLIYSLRQLIIDESNFMQAEGISSIYKTISRKIDEHESEISSKH